MSFQLSGQTGSFLAVLKFLQLKLKYATFEGGFSCFLGDIKKTHEFLYMVFSVRTEKLQKMQAEKIVNLFFPIFF